MRGTECEDIQMFSNWSALHSPYLSCKCPSHTGFSGFCPQILLMTWTGVLGVANDFTTANNTVIKVNALAVQVVLGGDVRFYWSVASLEMYSQISSV